VERTQASLTVLDSPTAGRAVIRGGAVRSGGYLIGVLLSLASMPLITRHLGVDDFGRFITISSLVTIVAGISEAGITNIGVREFTLQEPDARFRLLRSLLGIRLVITMTGVLAAVAFAGAVGYPRILVFGTAVAGAGLVLTQLQATFTIPLASSLRFGWISALELLRQAVAVTFYVLLVVMGAHLLPFFASYPVAGGAALVATILVVRKGVPLAPAVDLAEWRALLRDMLPYAAATALGIVYFRVTIIMLSLLAPASETGYFSAAFRVFEVLGGIAWLMVPSAFPILARAARDDPMRLRYVLQRTFEVAVIVGVGFALVTFVGAGFTIHVVAGATFDPSIAVLRIDSIAMLASFLVATWGFALLSLRRHGALMAANGISLAVALAAAGALIPPYGARGAAVSVITAEFTLAAAYGMILTRGREALTFDLRVVPRVAVAAGVACAAGVLSPIPNVAQLFATGIVYIIALATVRAIPPEVRAALPLPRRTAAP
jgi:O-antigen/teichoic acid export membrane protein